MRRRRVAAAECAGVERGESWTECHSGSCAGVASDSTGKPSVKHETAFVGFGKSSSVLELSREDKSFPDYPSGGRLTAVKRLTATLYSLGTA